MQNSKCAMFAITLICMLLLAACGNGNGPRTDNPTRSSTTNQGTIAPMFDLYDLEGNEVALENLAGEKVYVKYWASWCPICLAGLEELNMLAAEEDNDFRVLSIVSPDFKGEQSEQDFIRWYRGLGANRTTVLLDVGGTWAQKFGVRGYPTSYYIGSDGVLVKTAPGHHSNDQIKNTFKNIN